MEQHQARAIDQAMVVGALAEQAGVEVDDQSDPCVAALIVSSRARGVDAGSLFTSALGAIVS
jgi:hypothetical protein